MRASRLSGVSLVGVAVLICVASAGAKGAPRFTLSATSATSGDVVTMRRSGAVSTVATRLYLVPTWAKGVRSRIDPRLHFIGTIDASRAGRLAFTLPPLEPGAYAFAYWCRGCLPPHAKVAIAPTPHLRVDAPVGEGCPTTSPNEDAPPGVPRSGWRYHGNGHLAVLLPSTSTTLTTNSLGGYKMFWIARPGLFGAFRVSYRRLDVPSTSVDAGTVRGSLGGFDGPSWASRMSFEPGCWVISARVSDVSLGFVVEVERGEG
jgi:hypothetical protein